MERFHIRAEELLEEELDYELKLRIGPSAMYGLDDGRRVLRNWLRSESDDEYSTTRTMVDEYWVVLKALQDIESDLRGGRPARCKSRLIHYYRRLWRAKANSSSESINKIMLMDMTQNLMATYFKMDLSLLYLPEREKDRSNTEVDSVSFAAPYTTTTTSSVPAAATNTSAAVGAVSTPTTATVSTVSTAPVNTSSVAPSANLNEFLEEIGSIFEIESQKAEARRRELAKRILENAPQQLDDQYVLFANRTVPATSQRFQSAETRFTSSVGRIANLMDLDLPVQPTASEQPSTMPLSCTQRSLSPPLSRLQSSENNTSRMWPTSTSLINGPPGPSFIPGRTQPNLASTYQNCFTQSPPVQTNPNPMDFVHRSEIEDYVRAYVRNLMNPQPNRPVVRDTVVENLADQIANMGMPDQEVSRIDQPEGRVPPTVPVTSTRMNPPVSSFITDSGMPPWLGAPPRFPGSTLPAPNFGSRPQVSSFPDAACGAGGEVRPSFSGIGTHSTPTLCDGQRNPIPPFLFPEANPAPPTNRDAGPAPGFQQPPNWFPDPNAQNWWERRRLPHQTCNVIEKWPKFAGDANVVPVGDFLHQIELRSRSYKVSKEELKTHAHLLFKDDAYTWFTAYEKKFDCWDTLVYYLRLRYDNPNRDRFTKEEMRNREQKPNELFSAFLTDIEMLSQRLTRPMSEQEKFEIIVENMKMSYKRRLALTPVYSIDHLAQLCYRFDTLEGKQQHPPGKTKKPLINEVILDDEGYLLEADFESEGEIDVVNASTGRGHRFRRSDATRGSETNETVEPNCWNCRRRGHLWRECDQPKAIFCHICGHEDTTAFKCPQQHNIRAVRVPQTKNE